MGRVWARLDCFYRSNAVVMEVKSSDWFQAKGPLADQLRKLRGDSLFLWSFSAQGPFTVKMQNAM